MNDTILFDAPDLIPEMTRDVYRQPPFVPVVIYKAV